MIVVVLSKSSSKRLITDACHLTPPSSLSYPSSCQPLSTPGPPAHHFTPFNLSVFTMFATLTTIAFALSLVVGTSGHGYVHNLEIQGKSYSGYLPFTDP